jgi:hypothetical protein
MPPEGDGVGEGYESVDERVQRVALGRRLAGERGRQGEAEAGERAG